MLVTNSLTNSLTDSCLVNLIDVTLACEDAYSKLEVVTVAGVGDEDCVGNSVWDQIWLSPSLVMSSIDLYCII